MGMGVNSINAINQPPIPTPVLPLSPKGTSFGARGR